MNAAETPAELQRTHTLYSEPVRTTAADTDALGHVSNLVYLQWVQEIAKNHSAARGLDLQAYQDLGGVFVVRRHEIEYLRPVLAQENLHLYTWVAQWGAATSQRETRMYRSVTEELVCRATTRWAYVDVTSGRPKRIPPAVREAFAPNCPDV